MNEAVHGDATHERRAELAAELARLGVIINEPVAGLTYVSRAQDALIRGAHLNLTLSLSELIDPFLNPNLDSSRCERRRRHDSGPRTRCRLRETADRCHSRVPKLET